MKLEDEALSGVNGGVVIQKRANANAGDDTKLLDCPACDKQTVFKLYTGGRAICTICGYQKNDA